MGDPIHPQPNVSVHTSPYKRHDRVVGWPRPSPPHGARTMHIAFTDPTALEEVKAQFGSRYAKGLPVYGPIVMEAVGAIDQIFLLAQVKRIMVVNGLALASPLQLQKSAMAVIRYVNAGPDPWYFHRVRSAGSWQWQLRPVAPEDKEPLRVADREFNERSRQIVHRTYDGAQITEHAHATMPDIPITPEHREAIKRACLLYMAKFNMEVGAIKSREQMVQLFDRAGEFITQEQGDEIMQYDYKILCEAIGEMFSL